METKPQESNELRKSMGSMRPEPHASPMAIFITYLFAQLEGLIKWLIPKTWHAKRVDQDVVLITGAGSGLGRSLSLEYARLGSSLVLWDINEAGLQETQDLVEEEYRKSKLEEDSHKAICLKYRVDVSNRSEIYKFAKQVSDDLNKDASGGPERYVSVLVNNAGIYYGLYFHELSDEQIERIFKINILAHFWTVRAFLPKMVEKRRGHIVEIASVGGLCGMLKQVDYCATKFATVGFEESLSLELEHLGLKEAIRTTVVCPYFFGSNLFTDFDTKAVPLMSQRYVAREAVLSMRCNEARVILPKSQYISNYVKSCTTRDGLAALIKLLNVDSGIRQIKGHAARAG